MYIGLFIVTCLILIVPSTGNVIHRGGTTEETKTVFGWEPWGTLSWILQLNFKFLIPSIFRDNK